MLCEPLDIADHYKILAEAFGIPDELYDFVGFDTVEAAATAAAEAEAKRLAEIKHQKDMRRESIDRNMLTILETVAQIFGITADELVESIADTENRTESVHRFFRRHGSETLIISYAPRLGESNRINVMHENDLFQTDQCMIVYRADNSTEITVKNMANIVNISDIKPNESLSMPFILARIFREIWLPAFVQFGQAENTDTVMVIKACELFLENCDTITKKAVALEIDSEFYNKNLSDPKKIQATSESRHLVNVVERVSMEWMRVIEKILIKGKVIRRNDHQSGPIDELEHWLQTHSMYSIAQELMSKESFVNHMECLKLSGSKLVNKWQMIGDKLKVANFEASENVQFLNSLERFQFPLYGKLENIKAHIEPLFVALRSVYKTSTFYNTSNAMASFLTKCTNHLTLACRRFIADGDSINLFLQPSTELLQKIFICLDLLQAYQRTFEATMAEMQATNETVWDFAEKYAFGQSNQLIVRLLKLQEIIETDIKYAVLDGLLMENIQDFLQPINKAHDEITKKPYDHLDIRNDEFDADFEKWKGTMQRVEKEMHEFVMQHISQFPTKPLIALNHLKRFESLNFDCLTVEDRYVDITVAFVNYINTLKDSFNLKKVSPVIPNLMCTYSGRITWTRSIETKMNEIIELVRTKAFFTDDKKLIIQRTIKFYNALSRDLTLYELQQYKAWFDTVHHVFDLLSQPVIRRNAHTNRLEVNFDIAILNTIEEGKKMTKLRLDMPHLGEALVTYEDDLKRKLRTMRHLIRRNDDLRLSIPIIFVNIFRPQLQRIDKALKAGLSQIQWLSKDFDDYVENAVKVLDEVGVLIKRVSDRKVFHIEDIILSMSELKLIVLFDKPTEMKVLIDENEKHKKETAQKLVTKSIMAQKATVELIHLFIEHTNISTTEDKYDFMAFEKIFQHVFVYNDGDHIEPLFKDYDELQYGIEQLHSDCMDLFNYFAHLILDGMIKGTRKAYDAILERFFLREVPAVLAVAKLDPATCCYLSPPLESLSESFLQLIHNITDIFRGVDSWGALAAVAGSTKYNLDEINLTEGFLNNVLGNKEIQRSRLKFDSGLSLLQPQIDSLLKGIYTKNRYLWPDDLEEQLQRFVDTDPYPSSIEDEFCKYQQILDELDCAEKIIQINCIAIGLNEVYDEFLMHARKWKRRLAEILAEIYKHIYDELNDFIQDTECILRRELKDEEDFTAAIECLLHVYQNSERLETNLYKTTETYAILEKFHEPIGKVDKADIDQLAVRYANTFANAKGVEVYIRNNFDEIMSKI